MAINRSVITTAEITDVQKVAIEMVSVRPTNAYYEEAGTPNVLVGYYDSATDVVELYVRDASGHRFLKLV